MLIGLGSNRDGPFGAPPASIRRAIGDLVLTLGSDATSQGVPRASSLWRSPAWPAGSGPPYVNAVLAVPGSSLAPGSVLEALHGVEARAGRERGARWAARSLDLDLLAMDEVVAPDPAEQARWREAPRPEDLPAPDLLILPHPRLQERAFVLAPLAEVAPRWRHPLTGRGAADMLAALPEAERAAVVRIARPPVIARIARPPVVARVARPPVMGSPRDPAARDG